MGFHVLELDGRVCIDEKVKAHGTKCDRTEEDFARVAIRAEQYIEYFLIH